MAIVLKEMKIKPLGIKVKLVLSYIFVVIVSFLFAAYLLNKYLEKQTLDTVKSSLINQAVLIESQIPAGSLAPDNAVFLYSFAKNLGGKISARITIVDLNGDVLADSEKPPQEVPHMENHALRPEIRGALGGSAAEFVHYSSILHIDMLYVAVPVKDNGSIVGAVRLAIPLVALQKQFELLRKIILGSFVFALLLAFILASLFAAGIIRPLHKIMHSARKFSGGEFSHKIMLSSKDEIGALADDLNMMAQGLEEKIKEVQLRNQHLSAILQSMVEGIIVTDKTSRILSVNPPAETIFDIGRAAALGKLFLEAIPVSEIAEIMEQVLKSGKFLTRELSLIWPVHKICRVDVSAIYENDEASGCLIVIHDITELRRLETLRKDFVANVSHELKTPLTSIKGFVETLLEGALSDKENARQFLAIIQDQASRLDSLINDLLSLSHLESKEITVTKEDVRMQELTDTILAGFSSQLKKKSLTVTNELAHGLTVRADTEKLRQVLTNYIDNAIKFNHENGSIKVYAQEQASAVKIVVEDTGVGIPAKDIPRVFERFYRVDKARSREMGGTGLGLSIVKHIIELHAGSVGVSSDEGFGSKFWFTIPK